MSDFTERARAEADRLRASDVVLMTCHDDSFHAGYGHGFRHGASWARRELLADPTEAEVDAVAGLVELSELCHWGDNETAERIIAAFLEARRGSE